MLLKVRELTVTTRAWGFSPCQIGKCNACFDVNNLVKGKSVHEERSGASQKDYWLFSVVEMVNIGFASAEVAKR